MAQNYRQPGVILTLTVGATTSSGDAVIVGDLFGVIVAKDDSDNTKASVQVSGVFTLPKNGSQAVTQGSKVYWNTTNNNVGTTSTDLFVGHAIAAAAATDTTLDVRLQLT